MELDGFRVGMVTASWLRPMPWKAILTSLLPTGAGPGSSGRLVQSAASVAYRRSRLIVGVWQFEVPETFRTKVVHDGYSRSPNQVGRVEGSAHIVSASDYGTQRQGARRRRSAPTFGESAHRRGRLRR